MASRWLRSAKRAASKRALTVALAVALVFPSLNPPAHRSVGGDFAVGGAGSAHQAIELVLPSSQSAVAAEQAAPAWGVSGAVSGGRTAASKAAFVAPWGQEEAGRSGVGGAVGGAGLSPKRELSAAAVRAPSASSRKRFGGKNAKSGEVKDGTKDALRTMATKAGDNGREIAADFGGHIQVWWRLSGCCACAVLVVWPLLLLFLHVVLLLMVVG